MQRILKGLLLLCALILTFLCIKSVSGYTRFSEEKTKREAYIFEQMKCIKEVENFFFEANGTYTKNMDSLVFYCKALNRCNCDSIAYIPFSDGKMFDISFGKAMDELTGKYIDIVEIKAPYVMYLHGLNKDEISGLQVQSSQAGAYPGLMLTVK